MAKCIYCGVETDLSESDIIPDALTNSKLTKTNVCRILHNNNFSDLFEAAVINKLTFLRDKLDIQTKSHKYPETEINIKIEDTTLKKKTNKNSTLFGNSIMSGTEENIKFGPLEQITKIAESKMKQGKKISDIKEIDLNNLVIETQIPIDLEVFFSTSAKRLMAKIAYEWYCYHNNIEDYNEEFSEIVDYICTGSVNNKDLVRYIKDINIYSIIDQNTQNGSHTLIAYEKSDGSINVLVSFFGICIYNVEILKVPTSKFKNNCILQEFQVTSKKVTLIKQSIKELNQFISENTTSFVDKFGRIVCLAKDMNNAKIWEGVLLYLNIEPMLRSNTYLEQYDDELIKLRYNKVLNESVIHIRALKRFVKERFPNNANIIKLNPNGTDPENISMFYIVFLVGKSNIEKIDINVINDLIKQAFSVDNEVKADKDLAKRMILEITSTEEYSAILNVGAKKIKEADYD